MMKYNLKFRVFGIEYIVISVKAGISSLHISNSKNERVYFVHLNRNEYIKIASGIS